MISIPSKITKPLDKDSLQSLNSKIAGAISKGTVLELNKQQRSVERDVGNNVEGVPPKRKNNGTPLIQQNSQQSIQASQIASTMVQQSTAIQVTEMIMPPLKNQLRKGQKTLLNSGEHELKRMKVCFGWNVTDNRCDIDASAFLITGTGKVPDDSWFVFYSQTESPDNSVIFTVDSSKKDREIISVDLDKINPQIQKIVFVLTINEAFEQNLNFSMIKDAYIRILDSSTNQEIVSYQLEEYYANVTSMTIGELYVHNGQWKFNPVGNGVHQDLAGQCAIYGVEIG